MKGALPAVDFPQIKIAQALWEEALAAGVIHFKVLEVLKNVPSGATLCVACSGGSDSVCVLWLMAGWAACTGGRIAVLHYNHCLRGEHSDADADWVQAMSAHLGCDFFLGKAPESSDKSPSEGDLRALRHAFFREILQRTGSQHLILGHQLGDVAETFLMRWMRGSTSRGLCAPRPVQSHALDLLYARPLIHASKQWITEALVRHAISWREDASNARDVYVRNFLRLNIIPQLEQMAPQPFASGIERTRSLLEEEDEALEIWVDSVWPEVVFEDKLKIDAQRILPRGLIRRVLWRYFLSQSLSPSAAVFDATLEAVYTCEDLRMSAGEVFLCIQKGLLFVEEKEQRPEPYAIQITSFPAHLEIPWGNLILEVAEFDPSARLKDACWLPLDTLFPLTVRTWRPGDSYKGLGAPGRKKVQDHFVDRKIPKALRGLLPLILDASGDILWVPGLVPSEKSRIHEGNVHALRLTYRRQLA